MNRDKLIDQVKKEYAEMSAFESQDHFNQSTTDKTPEAYYESILEQVINEISKGTFDDFKSGEEIVEAIANDKTWLTKWK